MEMKANMKDAKKAAEHLTTQSRQPMRMLHRWGVKSDHAYLAGFVAVGLALVFRIFGHKDESNGSGWRGFFSKAAPLCFLVGLGLDREE